MRLMNKETFLECCMHEGRAFIKNFELYYDDPILKLSKKLDESYKSIIETKILSNKSYEINIFNLMDWFFTAAAVPEDFMEHPSSVKLKAYGDFVINLLYGEKTKDALNHAIKKNITYQINKN